MSSIPLARPTRRTVVRNVAWTVPVVTAAAAAPAFAASTCASPKLYRLNWGDAGYSHTTADVAYAPITSSNGGATIYAHFSTIFQGNGEGDGTFNGQARNLSVPSGTAIQGQDTTRDPLITNLGGLGSGERGIRFQQRSPQGYDNRQDITVTFRSGTAANSSVVNVQGLSFYIVDIDNLASPAYADRVALISAVAFDQTRDTTITGAGTVLSPWLNSAAGNQSENASGARVQINFPDDNLSRISTFKMAYWTNTGATGSNTGQYHRIYLSDFSLKTCP